MDKYKYYKSLNNQCPICMRKIGLYSIHTFPERYFRCFCCWDCVTYINFILEKSNRREYNYYENLQTNLHRKYISRVLSVAFGNEDKPQGLHLSKEMYFHPNSREQGSDPMIL